MSYNDCFMIIIHTMSLNLIEMICRTELIIDIGQATVIDIFGKRKDYFDCHNCREESFESRFSILFSYIFNCGLFHIMISLEDKKHIATGHYSMWRDRI